MRVAPYLSQFTPPRAILTPQPGRMSDARPPALPASRALESVLSPLLVRNLDTGEARPVTHGTSWTGQGGTSLSRPSSVGPVSFSRNSGNAADVAAAAGGVGTAVKIGGNKKGRKEFRGLRKLQGFRAHVGPIRVLAVSPSGSYVASAGSDGKVCVWRVGGRNSGVGAEKCEEGRPEEVPGMLYGPYGVDSAVADMPFVTFNGHALDVVSLSWSKNDFLLTASMDRTVRLWHPSLTRSLRKLPHTDFVTTVTFHPQDEQICVSGCADGVLRLWHLKECKLLSVAETGEVLTATRISPDGKNLLAGTVVGRCKFYTLFDEIQGEWQLFHTTQMDVRSSRGKNKKAAKICGISFNELDPNEVIISSADSRIRVYRMDDKSVKWKYVGHVVQETQLSCSMSMCGSFLLSGSENKQVVLWEMEAVADLNTPEKSGSHDHEEAASGGKDRSAVYEAFAPHDNDAVTAAVFSKARYYPLRNMIGEKETSSLRTFGLVVVTASDAGEVSVFACT